MSTHDQTILISILIGALFFAIGIFFGVMIMYSSKLAQHAVHRNALLKQIEAAHMLLEAAHMQGNEADVIHLRKHAHALLDQYHQTTATYFKEMVDTINGGAK